MPRVRHPSFPQKVQQSVSARSRRGSLSSPRRTAGTFERNFAVQHDSDDQSTCLLLALHDWTPLKKSRRHSCLCSAKHISDAFKIVAATSSTTTISISPAGKSCSRTLTMAPSMKRSWLYVSIRTLTAGIPISTSHLEIPSLFRARQYRATSRRDSENACKAELISRPCPPPGRRQFGANSASTKYSLGPPSNS
jgi:hypothetical protein